MAKPKVSRNDDVDVEKIRKDGINEFLNSSIPGKGTAREILNKVNSGATVGEDIDCPTCHKGHVHKLEGAGNGRVKCTGEGCGIEYAMIPVDAKYQCTNCHAPHAKLGNESSDECPFCGGTDFEEPLFGVNKKRR